MTWTMVIILVAMNNNSPAITSIPGFKSEASCNRAKLNALQGSEYVFDQDKRPGLIISRCIKVD